MLLPFYKAVYPPPRHPKTNLPKPPKIHLLPSNPPPESAQSSYVASRPSIPAEFTRNVDFPRRATHPVTPQNPRLLRSPPTLSVSQTPGGGNPSSVTSWFGSWIRRGGPLAVSTSGATIESSPSPTQTNYIEPRRDSDPICASPEVDVIKDSTGEVIEVKLTTTFAPTRPATSPPQPFHSFDVRRRGSMTLHNVTFTDDVFRITSYHNLPYHPDFHVQSMESTPDVETEVFRALKEDILFFSVPPVIPTATNPTASPEIPRFPPGGQRKVACLIADLDDATVTQLAVRQTEDEELQDREPVPAKDDRLWRKIQSWASDSKNTTSIDELVKLILS
jgi:hypothetical protein